MRAWSHMTKMTYLHVSVNIKLKWDLAKVGQYMVARLL